MPKTMTDLSNKTCLCRDHGSFLPVARRFSRDFKETYYYTPWEHGGASTSNDLTIGFGIPGISRVRRFWNCVDFGKPDLIVFCDCDEGDTQEHLRRIGHRMWGSGVGGDLELFRWELADLMKKVGLPVPPGRERIFGFKALREYLKTHKNKFIKYSLCRADFETFHHEEYFLSEPVLDFHEHKLGFKKDLIEFTVWDEIPNAREVGYDGYCVDGEFPKKVLYGVEHKDLGYFGRMTAYKDLPESLRFVNEKLAPTLKRIGYRGPLSTEVREADEPYLVDVTARYPSPPSEAYGELFTNFSEIAWHGAGGELIDPIPAAECVCQLILTSSWAEKDYLPIDVPKEIEQWVKWKNLCRTDGHYKVIPVYGGLQEVGGVVAYADTVKKAKDLCVERAKQVRGVEIRFDESALDKAVEAMEESQA